MAFAGAPNSGISVTSAAASGLEDGTWLSAGGVETDADSAAGLASTGGLGDGATAATAGGLSVADKGTSAAARGADSELALTDGAASVFALAAALGVAFGRAAAALAFFASTFLALASAGVARRKREAADGKHSAAKKSADRMRVDLMEVLSNAKWARRSSESADSYFTVTVSERGKESELGPTIILTGPDSTAQPEVS